LVFHAELNRLGVPWNKWEMPLTLQPFEGELDTYVRKNLVKILQKNTQHQTYYFFDSLYCILFEGNLEDVLLFPVKAAFPAVENPKTDTWANPRYWWPEDKAWCIYTDPDLCFSLIGGNSQLINALIDNQSLEVIALTDDTRIDNNADKINVILEECPCCGY